MKCILYKINRYILSRTESWRAHPCADNVHETSASLISRRVTRICELGAMAGASSRTKHLEQGDTAGLVSPLTGSMSSGCLLTERTRIPLEGDAADSLHSTWRHTYTGPTVGTFMIKHCCLLIYNSFSLVPRVMCYRLKTRNSNRFQYSTCIILSPPTKATSNIVRYYTITVGLCVHTVHCHFYF